MPVYDKVRFQQLLTDQDFIMAATLGFIPGVETVVKFGHCPDVAAVVTDVWERGLAQPLYLFPASAGEAMEILGNVVDTQDVVVIGLDETGLPKTATVTLNGTTPVALPGVWSAINKAYVDSATRVAGPVLIQGDGSTSAEIFAQISTKAQQTAQAVFRVPSNKVAVIVALSNAVNKGGGSGVQDIKRLVIAKPGKVFRTRLRYGLQKTGTSNIPSNFRVPTVLGPSFDVKAQAEPDAASVHVSTEFSMILFPVEYFSSDFLANII